MLPLIYLGITSFTLSFTISNFLTSEILRNRFKSKIKQEKRLQPKSLSKVKFNQEIKVRYIPTRECLSSNTLSNLWYSNQDLTTFKHNYLFEKKYKSI
jgi:hypothetical protein